MSLNSIISTASSGMFAAQIGLNTTSDNVSNLNTPGYIEKVVDLTSTAIAGVGSGAQATGVRLAANQFLQNANLSASADLGQANIVSDLMSQAQSLFGDPGSSTGYFNLLNQVSADFNTAASDPASSLSGIQVVNDVGQFLNQSQSISASLGQIAQRADTDLQRR